MAEHPTVPPLSGEIMAGADRIRAARFDASGAAEGDYETVGARPPLPPRAAEPVAVAPARPAGMAVLNQPVAAAAPREKGGPVFWSFGMVLIAAAFWIAGGHALFAHAPAPAFALAPPFHLATLTTRIVPGDNGEVVLVDGELLNESARSAAVPALDIAVTGRGGAVTHYVLGTSGEAVAAGARYAFSSRLQAPKQGVDSVLVTVRRKEAIE